MLNRARLGRRLFACKIYENPQDAISDIRNFSRLAIGGFGPCGVPENLIKALQSRGTWDLTVYTMGCGIPNYGVDSLLQSKQIRRLVTSFLGTTSTARTQYVNGELELELVPEGSLAERIRAAGAGMPAFYTMTGVGTVIEEGSFPIKYGPGGQKVEIISSSKEKRQFNGRDHLLEEAINVDFALIKAWKADTHGNLIYHRTARNFNPEMAMSSRYTIAEVEEIVEAGTLDPDYIHTPGIFVKGLVKGDNYEKPFEYKTSSDDGVLTINKESFYEERIRIAKRAAREIHHGMYVNLGLGIPSLISNFINPNAKVIIHTVSGILGMGKYPKKDEVNPDIVNTNREPVTLNPGACIRSSNDALDMVRGGHIDMTFLGALQVSQNGDLANWIVPGKYIGGIGASMDLVANRQSRKVVTMLHTNQGTPKIVEECTLPITGVNCIDLLITDKGVFDFRRPQGITLVELAKGVTLDLVQKLTPVKFAIASDLKEMPEV
jgi:3-oxoacid CoA-transferase